MKRWRRLVAMLNLGPHVTRRQVEVVREIARDEQIQTQQQADELVDRLRRAGVI